MRRASVASLAFVTVSAAAIPAHAGGFFTRFAGEEGFPTTDHVVSAYYNPAGLAMRSGTRFVLETNVGYRAAAYTRSPDAIGNVLDPGEAGAGTPQDALDVNSGPSSLSNTLFLPFLGVASDLGVKNLGVAFTITAPFGGSAKWDQNAAFETSQYPGAIDGTQRWVIIEGEQRSLYLTAAGAYYLPAAKLSFGAGVNFVMSNLKVLRARTVSGTDDIVTDTGMIVEGRSLADVSGNAFSLSAGLQWQPVPELRLGVGYQSQPGFGTTRMSGTLSNKFGSTPTASSDVELEQALPDVLRVGAAIRPMPALEIRVSVDWQHWSVFENQCFLDVAVAERNCALNDDGSMAPGAAGIVANIPRNWKDSWGMRTGASYRLNGRVKLMGGFSYDKSAVPDATLDAGLLDLDKVVVDGGARFTVSGGFDVVAGWTQVIYFEKTTAPVPPSAAPSTVPGNAGRYQQDVGLFQLALEYQY